MINKRASRTLLFVLVSWIFTMACTQERSPCLTPLSSVLIMHTYHLATDTNTIYSDTTLPYALLVALPKPDSGVAYLYGPNTSFNLSLSPIADSCRWLITPDSSKVATFGFDTLTFHYQRQLKFISNACGYTYYFSLGNVNTTKHNIDSVHIANANVTSNVNTVHLQVYIHPDY